MNILADDLDEILEKSRPIFNSLKGARIFITGGTGFIGVWLLEAIAWANKHINSEIHLVVLCRNPSAMLVKAPHLMGNPDITYLQSDVRDFQFPREKFSHVIHAATAASEKLNTESPLEMMDTIISGARRVLDFTIDCGASTFLQLSSCAVYGRQPPEMPLLKESYFGGPDVTDRWSAYGEGKRVSELLGTIYANENCFEHKIARVSSVVGPYMPLDIHFAIGNFIRNALNAEDIIIKGDGRPFRANLYIADAIIWLLTILLQGKNNRPYNVGSDDALSLKEMAQEVCNASGLNQSVIVQQKKMSNEAAPRYVASIQRCREELGLEQWTDLGTAIKKTIAWNKKSTQING